VPSPPITGSSNEPTGKAYDKAMPAPDGWAGATPVLDMAMSLRGVPYRNGGSDPRGFDCSGFTQYVFASAGTHLPRETREQFLLGTVVPVGQQLPGDLIFFSTTAPGASHVGIAIGGDRFVHAPSSRGVVRIESMEVPYWSQRLVGIRRLGADSGSAGRPADSEAP
jgi:peptidoglycan DL-endopeptidase CwlO